MYGRLKYIYILTHESVKELRFIIIQLTETVLRDTLIDKQCNPNGEIDILRDRLLPAALKENEKCEHLVPWYKFDEATQIFDDQADNKFETT